MKKRKYIFAFLIFSFYSSIPCISQDSPCEDLDPQNSNLGYSNIGNRCEGFYNERYSGSLQLVSFTRGEIDYELGQNTVLHIQTSSAFGDSLNVRAVALPPNIHYQMDAKVSSKEVFEWPATPYLIGGSITADKLGVYGWKELNKVNSYIPVVISQDGSSENQAGKYILKFMIISDLTHFRWRYLEVDASGNCRSDNVLKGYQDYDGDLIEGSIIAIEVEKPVNAKEQVCLDVLYRAVDMSPRHTKPILLVP